MSTASAIPESSDAVTQTPALEPILQTEKLVKIYGGRAVVNGVDPTAGGSSSKART